MNSHFYPMKNRLLLLTLIISSLFTLNAQENLIWKFKTGDFVYSTPLIHENTIYIGSGDHNFYCLDRKTGKMNWQFETDGAIHSSPCIYEDLVFFGSDDGNFYALNRISGDLAWKYESDGEKSYDLWDYYRSSPAAAGDLIYWGCGDGIVYAIAWNSGKLVWKFKTGDVVHASPVISNGRVYIGGFDGFFYALNAENGDLIWKFNTVGAQYFPDGAVQKAALVEEEAIYFGSRDYNIYALDAETGKGRWNMREIRGWIIATPLSYEGKLYFGTSDSHLFYCMDKNNGAILWQIHVPMRVYGAAVAHNNLIYFGCFDGKVYGIDPDTGKTKWEFQTASDQDYYKVFDENGGFNKEFQLYG